MCPARIGEYRELPGPKGKEWLERAKRVSITAVQNELLVFDDEAPWLGLTMYDVDGNVYMDFFSGAGVNNLGHAPQDILEAVSRQRAFGPTCYDETVFPVPIAIRLRERLAALAPGDQPRKVFLSNSGTEAVEAAIKMLESARPERGIILAFENAFHGRTKGSLALNGSREVHTAHFLHGRDGVYHIPFPSYRGALDHFFQRIGHGDLPIKEINAAVLEIVQGEGGVNVPDPYELKRFESWLRANDIYIVADEIQTGIGRTGRFFASEYYDLNPDIILVAKALANGSDPCGATIANADLDFDEKGQHANTFGGHYSAMAAAHAVLDRFEQDGSLLRNVNEVGHNLKQRLRGLSQSFNGHFSSTAIRMSEPRGLGLMLAVDLIDESARDEYGTLTAEASAPRDRVVEETWRRGLILEGTGTRGIRFLPPLIVNREQIDIMMKIFEEAIEAAFDINISYTPDGV